MRSVVVPRWLGVAAALSVACSSRDAVPDSAAVTVAPTVVNVSANDSTIEAPDTLSAGFITVRLVNHGTEGHGATLVRLGDGKTLPEYLDAYDEANRIRGPRPAWASFHGGAAVLPGAEAAAATLYLEPGNYAWVCFVPGPDGRVHLRDRRQAHAFVVVPRGEVPAPAPPEPTISVRMVDFGYELSGPVAAGKHLIQVTNAGVEPHHTILFRLAPGKALDDFKAWVANQMQGEGPAEFVGALAEQTGGTRAWLEVDLAAGNYVLVCLVAGRDEEPHMAKGMIQQIQVE
jgi:hypothetical protein